jgi:acetyl-CoA carboxylase carboxyltransferase component
MHAVRSPLQARIVQWCVPPGTVVAPGQVLLVLEAMKMEHEVRAPVTGCLGPWQHAMDAMVDEGALLVMLTPVEAPQRAAATTGVSLSGENSVAAQAVRADLQRLQDRLAWTEDARRPEAVARRHAGGLRTVRENIAALCDAGSFIEYGALALAAQSRRRSAEELMRQTPADGMVTGIGQVQGRPVAVLGYDATVLAGTQGFRNHQKTDRLLAQALQQRLPVVLLAEGGGGRPGDVDLPIVAGLHLGTFAAFTRLNGRVPVVGIVAGRCFAGNAALLGCCDLIIATRDSNIGMGGPAMVEGGGLGVFTPGQIGPSSVQHANGVIDVLVDNEAQAVAAAQQYLGLLAGPAQAGPAPDPMALRTVVPENRLRVYDSRLVMQGLVDSDSLLMLRTGFGSGVHTALGRLGGRAVGLMANNPQHLGGAIDADAADKVARFMQLCNAHGLPIVSLVDTPGFMVGPETEATAQVRHVARLFIAAGHLRVPLLAVVLRMGYGLGAMAMTAGGFHESLATVAWPTGEFGGMGLEGAVRLGYRKELEAVPEGPERQALYERLVAEHYEKGHALNMAATLEIDAVIDPADTRNWLLQALQAAQVRPIGASLPIDSW